MTNPQYGFGELAAAQSQPEVTVNAMARAITRATSGEIVIDFASDADYELQATSPLDPADEWPYATITMTDTGNNLTTARSVIFPDLVDIYGANAARHRFVFRNETSRSLTIKADSSGATGVTVAAGQSSLVQYDGEDVVEVAAASGGGGGGGGISMIPIQLAASQFGEALKAGTTVAYFRSPFDATIEEVRASVLVPNTSGDIEVNIKVNGVSILDDLIVIEQGEKTSLDADDQPSLVTGAALEEDDEVTIDIDAPSGSDAESLLVTMLVTPTT